MPLTVNVLEYAVKVLPADKLFLVARSVPTRATASLPLASIVLPLLIDRELPSVEAEFTSVVPVIVIPGVRGVSVLLFSDVLDSDDELVVSL